MIMIYFVVFLLVCGVTLTRAQSLSFYPSSVTTQSGSISSTPLSALRTQDQSKSQDTWANYVEFYGTSPLYRGIFNIPVTTRSASGYKLNVNFKGPLKSRQVWSFEWFVPSTNTWVFAGDNTAARSWVWTLLSFTGTRSFSSLVNSAGVVQIRFSSQTAVDNCDVDFLQLSVTASAPPTMRPTPTPTPTPTPSPTLRPTPTPTMRPPTSSPTTRPPTPTPTIRPPTSSPTTRPPTPSPTTRPIPTPTPPTSPPTTRPPTPSPTPSPTPAPTLRPPTPSPTVPPTSGGKLCGPGTRYRPGPHTTWQWQLDGTVDTSINVQLYDIDMFGSSPDLISNLHAQGRAVVCYIDTAYENYRPDSSQFTSAVLGNEIDGWPGQRWVDIRSSVVRNIMRTRMELAASKNCDAVEMDDVDAYQNNPGFPLSESDQINFNTFLASTAHSLDLGIALKNVISLVPNLQPFFDFAINEQCYQYSECASLSSFINQGKAVLGVEYSLSTSNFCPQANAARFSFLKKNLQLDAYRVSCCTSGCGAQYSCVSSASKRTERFTINVTAETDFPFLEGFNLTDLFNHTSLPPMDGFNRTDLSSLDSFNRTDLPSLDGFNRTDLPSLDNFNQTDLPSLENLNLTSKFPNLSGKSSSSASSTSSDWLVSSPLPLLSLPSLSPLPLLSLSPPFFILTE